MRLERLWLTDFRSYQSAELVPAPEGLTVVVGANGMGKTNLLEAVGYLASLRSFRGASGEALIRAGASRAVVRAEVERAGRLLLIEAELRPAGRDRVQVKKEKMDYLGTVLFASGLAFLVLAFNNVEKLGWGSAMVVGCFVGAFVLLSLFVFTELRVQHPLIDLSLFKNGTFLIGNLTGMLSYYVLFTVLFLMPFYFENVLNYSPALAGSLLTPIPLAMAVVAPFSGHISDKYGARIMTAGGMLVASLSCLALLFLGAQSHLPLLVGELVLLGVGMGMFTPPNNSAIMGAAPKEKLGLAGGILNMMRSLGLIFGVDISGLIFAKVEHKYLAEQGFAHVQHIFRNASIPVPVKDNAFMHGFILVIGVLLTLTVLSAVFSGLKKDGVIDAEAAEAAKAFVGE